MSLAGRLEDLAISDIFQILGVGRKSGTLIVSGSSGKAVIVFKNGLVIRAETDDLDKNLGEDLRDAGLIKDQILSLAIELRKRLPEKSLAEILLDFGSVSHEALDKAVRKRIEKVVYRLLLWEDGDFQFELDEVDLDGKVDLDDPGWELAKGMSPEYLLMEGARVHDESSQTGLMPDMPDEGFSDGLMEDEGWDEDWETPVAERKDISALKSLTRELRFPNSTSEITLLILRFASDIFQRGVLFMVGSDELVGLGQFGLDIERPDEKVRETVLRIDDSPFFRKILSEQISYKGKMEEDKVTREMIEDLGGVEPSVSAIFPIVAEGRAVALLYCDNGSSGEDVVETEGLEIFIDHAGLALEKSLLQRRIQEFELRKGAAEE